MIELQEIFDIKYGNSLDLNKLKQKKKGINFVSRTTKNNGVSAKVNEVLSTEKMPKGSITVSLGGSVLEAFVQLSDYYTGYHIYCLTQKDDIQLSTEQKLFYCTCIRANKYKYSYGRQANRTLKNLLVPAIDEIPDWVNKVNLSRFDGVDKPAITSPQTVAPPLVLKLTTIDKLFEIQNGIAATNLKESIRPFSNSIMYIRPASTHSRTLRSFIDKSSIKMENIYQSGSLFVSTNGEGSHSYSYVSTENFVPNSDVSVLIPKEKMSLELKIYYAKCITANRHLFSYGRKPKGFKLKKIKIPLFSDYEKSEVDRFVKSLSYSSNI